MDGVVTIAAVLIFLMAWVRSFRIDLSVNGIVYHSPFFRRAVVKWADLASVSSGASWRRTKWPFYMLIETHDASRPVRINIKVFGRGDLSALAATIRRRSPQATLDKATHRMSQGQMPSMLRRKSDSQGTA
ncbi:MAG TPA: hypothetical protein VLZ10_20080 [Thermodesulfobacteriota bacterium]|nr:hypothetical protein [Thermodesulfobacteriota bacterium]